MVLADGSALVSWLESTVRGEELRYRRVLADGRVEAAATLVRSARGRTIGFPQLARDGDDVLFAWTRPGAPSPGVRTARLPLGDGPR